MSNLTWNGLSPHQLWEYRRIIGSGSMDVVNQAGQEGWELVGVSVTNGDNENFYFKRPILNDEE